MSWYTNKIAGSIGSLATRVQHIAESALQDGTQEDHPNGPPQSVLRPVQHVPEVMDSGLEGDWTNGGYSDQPHHSSSRDGNDAALIRQTQILEHRNQELSEQLLRVQSHLTVQLDEKNEQIRALETRLAHVSLASSTATSPIPGQQTHEDLEQQIQGYRDKLGKAVHHLKHLTVENAELSGRVQGLDGEKEQMKREVQSLREEMDVLRQGATDVEEVKTYTRQLESELEARVESESALRQQLEEAIATSTKIATEDDSLLKLQSQLDESQSRAQELESRIQDLDGEKSKMEREVASLREEMDALRGAGDTVTTVQNELDQLKMYTRQLEAELEAKLEVESALRQELEGAAAKISTGGEGALKLQESQTRVQEFESRTKDLETQHQATSEQLNTLLSTHGQLVKEHETLQAQHQQLDTVKAELTERIMALETETQSLRSDMEQSLTEHLEAQNTHQQELEQALAEIEEAKAETQEWQTRNRDLTDALAEARTELEHRVVVNHTSSSSSTAGSGVEGWDVPSFDVHAAENEDLRTQIEELKLALQGSRKRELELSERGHHTPLVDDSEVAQLRDRITELGRSNTDLQAQLADQSSSNDSNLDGWDVPGFEITPSATLTARIAELESALAALHQRIAESERAKEIAQARCEVLEQEAHETDEAAAVEVERIQELHDGIVMQLMLQKREVEALKMKLEGGGGGPGGPELDNLKAALEKQMTLRETAEQELAELNARYQSLQQEFTHLESKLGAQPPTSPEEIQSLTAQISHLSLREQDLMSQLETTKSGLEAERDDYRAALDQTRNDLETLEQVLQSQRVHQDSSLIDAVAAYVRQSFDRAEAGQDVVLDDRIPGPVVEAVGRVIEFVDKLRAEQSATQTVDVEKPEQSTQAVDAIAAYLRQCVERAEEGQDPIADDTIPETVVEAVSQLMEFVGELRVMSADSLNREKALSEQVAKKQSAWETELDKIMSDHKTRVEALETEIAVLRANVTQSSSDDSETMKALVAAQEQVRRLAGEKTLLMEKLTQMKNAIAPKLQNEIETSNQLREEVHARDEEIAELRQQITQLATAHDTLRAKAGTSATDAARLHVELETARERADRLEREVDRLRTHLMETEDAQVQDALAIEAQARDLTKQVERAERERDDWEAIAGQEREAARAALERVDDLHDVVESLRGDMERLRLERERDGMAAANLQRVLAEFQDGKDAEIAEAVEDVSKKCAEAERGLAEWQRRAHEAEQKLEGVERDTPSAKRLQADLQERNVVIGKLRHDVVQLQTHLAEAMRRMRDAAASDENVDRRLITNLLVSFLSAPRADAKRYEILSVIGSVLKFEEDERVKVGLAKGPGVGGSLTGGGGGAFSSVGRAAGSLLGHTPNSSSHDASVGESFTDMWISFLLKESNPAKRRNSQSSPTTNQQPHTPSSPHPNSASPASPSAYTSSSPQEPTNPGSFPSFAAKKD
ncbi:hypothetical protein DFS34DRAFT_684005 [Phlyctochytrium arcticum]|nr:hypothetical protein DFS34DRAFT_684005 [Phlyctochytrium arcticum]